jgi:hypothetical protein
MELNPEIFTTNVLIGFIPTWVWEKPRERGFVPGALTLALSATHAMISKCSGRRYMIAEKIW